MAGFSSSIASNGGGGDTSNFDPSQYLGGQPQQGAQSAGGPQQQSPGMSPDFAEAMTRMGMKLEQMIDALSSQHPEGADDFKEAKLALRKAMAKVLATNPQASGGPQGPRMA